MREIELSNYKKEIGRRWHSLRHDESGLAIFETIIAFIALVIGLMVLVIVLSNIWSTFTSALTNYSTNETVFGPTVKQLTPILVGVGVLLVVIALVFGLKVFREGGLFT